MVKDAMNEEQERTELENLRTQDENPFDDFIKE